jgi:hypothetical protein
MTMRAECASACLRFDRYRVAPIERTIAVHGNSLTGALVQHALPSSAPLYAAFRLSIVKSMTPRPELRSTSTPFAADAFASILGQNRWNHEPLSSLMTAYVLPSGASLANLQLDHTCC